MRGLTRDERLILAEARRIKSRMERSRLPESQYDHPAYPEGVDGKWKAWTVVAFGPSFGLANQVHETRAGAERAAAKINRLSHGGTTTRIVPVSASTRSGLRQAVRNLDVSDY